MASADQPLADSERTAKRSNAEGMEPAQLELLPGAPEGGGSARRAAAARSRGGYPNICTDYANLKRKKIRADARDPRIADLRAARVGPVWIKVAERIGFEAFMQLWETLASFPGVGDDRNRVYVPCIEKFLASQRNLLIRELIAQGLNSTQIRQELVRRLGAAPALDTIKKAMRRSA